MDIISHSLTGVAIGTVVATVSNANWRQKSSILLLGFIGGALPDMDLLSLWSKFDSTIGSFFNINQTGSQIYSGKLWYSHHAAFHSILAPVLLILISIFSTFLKSTFSKTNTISKLIYKYRNYYLVFFLGFIFHIIEDMPTPSSSWGGVNLFFPSTNYIGGFGKIWWWNNYDLFLIICSVIFVNLIILLLIGNQKLKSMFSIGVFLVGFLLGIHQTMTRTVDFSYTDHTNKYNQFETESKRIQKEILGEKLYKFMERLDSKIPLNF